MKTRLPNTNPERRRVFVLGLDDFNEKYNLAPLGEQENVDFLPLLHRDDIKGGKKFDVAGNLAKAEAQLKSCRHSSHGIISHWDFPVSLMTPILCHRFDFPAAPLEAVFKCEHKYWSRLIQREITNACPAFEKVDPLKDIREQIAGLRRPLWIKPVKAYLGQLAFRITEDSDIDYATPLLRKGINRFAEPFDFLLKEMDLPSELSEIGGRMCIAEEETSGEQSTVEGFAWDGDITPYAVVDTIRYPGSPTLRQLEYPSRLPRKVQARMGQITRNVMKRIGYTYGPFNIEFFWNRESDTLKILEINPRISQSHAVQFRLVDGSSHHRIAMDLALGQAPRTFHNEGPYNCAAKFMLRHFQDGFVEHQPHQREIEEIQAKFPDTLVKLYARENTRLSHRLDEDSYSFLLAEIFVGADNHDLLIERWRQCRDILSYKITPIMNHASSRVFS